MTKTTTFPETIENIVAQGASVETIEGRNGRKIFVCSKLEATTLVRAMFADFMVYAIDTDDTDAWVVGWGPNRESVNEYVRLAK